MSLQQHILSFNLIIKQKNEQNSCFFIFKYVTFVIQVVLKTELIKISFQTPIKKTFFRIEHSFILFFWGYRASLLAVFALFFKQKSNKS